MASEPKNNAQKIQIEEEKRKQDELAARLREMENQFSVQVKEASELKDAVERRMSMKKQLEIPQILQPSEALEQSQPPKPSQQPKVETSQLPHSPEVLNTERRSINKQFDLIEKPSSYEESKRDSESEETMEIKMLQEELRAKRQELEDLESESLESKNQLFSELKEKTRMIGFYKQLISKQIGNSDLNRLRLQSQWSDKENCYSVPLFTMEENKLTFARLPRHEILSIIEQTFAKRRLVIEGEEIESYVQRSPRASRTKRTLSPEKGSIRSEFPPMQKTQLPQITNFSVRRTSKQPQGLVHSLRTPDLPADINNSDILPVIRSIKRTKLRPIENSIQSQP